MGELSYTTGGDSNLVSFKSAARVPITSLKAHFKPKQDLHGYSKPWIGGTGKNKLGFTNVENAKNNNNRTVTFTNDYIIINATGTNTTNAVISYDNMTTYCKIVLAPGTYAFSIQDFNTNIPNISKNNMKFIYDDNGTSYAVMDEETFTIINNCTALGINYSDKITWQSDFYMQFRLQIEEGSSVTNWEPYENICPIEGWQEIEVYQSSVYSPNEYQKIIPITFPAIGKNLLNKNNYGFKAYDSLIFGGNNSSARPDGTLILDAGTYTLFVSVAMTAMIMTHENGQQGALVTNTNQMTFACTSKEAVRLAIILNGQSSDHDMLQYNYQLEVGDTATEYEPFNNTIYGGYIDIAKGELVQEWLCVNLSDLNWQYNANWNMPNIKYADDFKNLNIIKATTSVSQYGEMVAEKYTLKPYSDMDADLEPGHIIFANTARLFASVLDQTEEIQGLACFKLVSPVTYKLSPIQLKTLLNQNYIWSNTNDITEVSYAIHDSAPIRVAKHRIAAAEPHIITTNNSFANFKTDMTAPIKSAKFYFLPKQSGTGDPSPSNIRPITGWSSIQVKTLNNYIPVLPLNEQEYFYDNTNTYRLQYLGNGKFKTVDNFSNAPLFNFDTIPITWNNNINKFLAISDIKNTIGAWIFTFSFRKSDNTSLLSGYLDYGNSSQTLVVTLGDISQVQDQTSSKMRLIIDETGIPQGTEFVMALTNDSDISSYTSDFSTSSATLSIYGGYVDLVKGELVQTYGCTNFNGTQSILLCNWKQLTSSVGWFFDISETPGIKTSNISAQISPNIFASSLKTCPYNGDEPSIYRTDDNLISQIIYQDYGIVMRIKDLSLTTIESINNYLSTNPITVVYELETPITYQLTPQSLKSIRGTNNIWTTANGPVEIQYYSH